MTSITRSKKLKPVAQEYLILVGAPTNMFNGFVYDDPGTNEVVAATPAPTSTDPAEIRRYMVGTDANLPHYTHDRFWANFLFSGRSSYKRLRGVSGAMAG